MTQPVQTVDPRNLAPTTVNVGVPIPKLPDVEYELVKLTGNNLLPCDFPYFGKLSFKVHEWWTKEDKSDRELGRAVVMNGGAQYGGVRTSIVRKVMDYGLVLTFHTASGSVYRLTPLNVSAQEFAKMRATIAGESQHD